MQYLGGPDLIELLMLDLPDLTKRARADALQESETRYREAQFHPTSLEKSTFKPAASWHRPAFEEQLHVSRRTRSPDPESRNLFTYRADMARRKPTHDGRWWGYEKWRYADRA